MTASIPGKDSSWSTVADRLNDALEGEYIIERELGRGGMAAVFLGYEPALGRRVAIKVMAPGLLLDSSMIQRFRQEAVTVASLSHPNIITIHAVRTVGELHCFIMKFVVGRPLSDILTAHGALPLPIVRHVLWEVGNALAYAHRQGVVHRDVKPGNILIDADGECVVTDFGIAKVAESTTHTQTGAAVGTPTYMSPEQCRGTGITWSADQYALGVVAFEMITGALPFNGTTFEIMQAHITGSAAPCGELDAVVRRMMAKTPDERFPSMGAALTAAQARQLSEDDPARVEFAKWATEGLDVALVRGVPSPVPRTRADSAAIARTTAPVAPTRITITGPAEITCGETVALRATAWNARGGEVPGVAVKWSTDAPELVRIDETTGAATAVAPGTVTIRATVGETRAAISVTTWRPTTPPPASTAAPTMAAAPVMAAAPAPVPTAAPRKKTGLVVGIAIVVLIIGAAVALYWKSSIGSGASTASTTTTTTTTTSTTTPPAPAHAVRWIVIEEPAIMQVGQQLTIVAGAYDVEQRPVAGARLAWSTDNPAVVSIDGATGVATAVAAGTAHVRAAAGGRAATVPVTVR